MKPSQFTIEAVFYAQYIFYLQKVKLKTKI